MHLVHSGMKIMQLTLKDYDISLTDSLNWFQMPLAKSFGLDLSTYSNGDFPHLFNRSENQNYMRALPDLVYSSPETRADDKERQELISWHTKMKEKGFFLILERRCISTVLKMQLLFVCAV